MKCPECGIEMNENIDFNWCYEHPKNDCKLSECTLDIGWLRDNYPDLEDE